DRLLGRRPAPGLRAILARATAAEPGDRYPSAREMAADLHRYQAGQLVSSSRFDLGQRIARFVRRYRDAVIASTAIAVMLGVVLVHEYHETEDKAAAAVEVEARAEAQRDAAEGLTRYMVDDLKTKLEPIGRLALLKDVGEKVDGYYQDIAEQGAGMSALARRARAVELRGDAARAGGDSAGALTLYRDALGLGLGTGDARQSAHVLLSVGDVLQERGDAAGAADAYQRAIDIAPALPKITANARLRLGMVAQARSDNDAALTAWRAAAADFERIAAGDPADLDALYNASMAHGLSGDALYEREQVVAALAELEQSLALARKLSAAQPDNPEWLRAISLPLDRIGEIHRFQGDFDAAERDFAAGLDVAEKVAARDPDNPKWQADIAISHRQLAQVASARGRYPEAIDHLRRGLQVAEKVARVDPDNLEQRQTLGHLLVDLSVALRKDGRAREALLTADRAVRQRRADLATAPDDAWTRYFLAEALLERADIAGAPRPTADLREARDLLAPLVAADGSMTQWRDGLERAERELAAPVR
ncbi:MAG TPA: tetratricopeptide repeat protein, partial [Kofleriaceae bacterium]|nr:tetratricopeptide repeat protein [Kofleriaceae bacterium]